MKAKLGRKSGQSMVEYIIIVVVIALATLAIVGVFSDRIRSIWGGAAEELGADQGKVDDANQKGAAKKLTEYENKAGGN